MKKDKRYWTSIALWAIVVVMFGSAVLIVLQAPKVPADQKIGLVGLGVAIASVGFVMGLDIVNAKKLREINSKLDAMEKKQPAASGEQALSPEAEAIIGVVKILDRLFHRSHN